MSSADEPKGASRTLRSRSHPSVVTRVKIRDVVARDGLQGERPVRPEQRVELIELLIDAGVKDIEVASFVSPTAVPAMASAADVVASPSRSSERRHSVGAGPQRQGG